MKRVSLIINEWVDDIMLAICIEVREIKEEIINSVTN